ncbi:MAG: DUF6359 domain-containing protein [Bacteroidales bacterium]|nr:DUF6359 domain-containing protein [Bacteroidales bacterium]
MKRGANFFARAVLMAAVTAALLTGSAACSKIYLGQGQIRLRFIEDGFAAVRSSETEIPDSNSFILEILGSGGEVIYKGLYGECPEEISAPSGSCAISVRSGEFSAPKFSAPLYGDDQCIVVPSGGEVNVALDCKLLNCGMALNISPDFLTAYPSGVLYLSSNEGKLMYSYTEKRFAYFMPGNISVLLDDVWTGEETMLMTRTLAAKEIMTVAINVAPTSAASSGGGISMQIDTSRTWLDDTYVIGGDNGRGGDASTAMSVSEAKSNVGQSGVWVYGYIVGGDLTSSASGISFSAPFSSTTNIAIAAKASVSDKASCLSVQLPSGDVRSALNLVENPSLLGHQVYLKGDITASYFNLVGIKNISAYELK